MVHFNHSEIHKRRETKREKYSPSRRVVVEGKSVNPSLISQLRLKGAYHEYFRD